MRQAESRDDAGRETVNENAEFAGELRDTERAISLWNKKSQEFGRPPPATEFDLSGLGTQGYRFIICADLLVKEDSVFSVYGPDFARLFDLPERPSMHVPMIRHVPGRYQALFAEGCDDAITEAAPVRFVGEVEHYGCIELYRACFMPLRMKSRTSQFVYGSFNYLTGKAISVSEPFQSSQQRFIVSFADVYGVGSIFGVKPA